MPYRRAEVVVVHKRRESLCRAIHTGSKAKSTVYSCIQYSTGQSVLYSIYMLWALFKRIKRGRCASGSVDVSIGQSKSTSTIICGGDLTNDKKSDSSDEELLEHTSRSALHVYERRAESYSSQKERQEQQSRRTSLGTFCAPARAILFCAASALPAALAVCARAHTQTLISNSCFRWSCVITYNSQFTVLETQKNATHVVVL